MGARGDCPRGLGVAAIALVFACAGAHAAIKLECYEEPGTRKTTCIAPSLVRANGNLRSSPLFAGAPDAIDRTSDVFLADCKKGTSALRDASGGKVDGSPASAAEASRALSEWMCAVPKPAQDKKLRAF